MSVGLDEESARETGPGDRVEVVHVITTLTTGGAERQLELLMAHSRRSSCAVTLYDAGLVADAIRAGGHTVLELDVTGWRKPLALLVLARQLRRLRPAIVHVHLLSAQLWGIPAARLARVPMVVSTEHSLMDDTIEGRPHTWWLRVLYRLLERGASHTIAVSEATAQRLGRWGVRADRVSVAELGIDLEALSYDAQARHRIRTELDLAPDTAVVVAVGRLAPVKRLDVALEACAPALAGGAVMLVVGEGPLLDDLRAHAERLGVAGQVRWLGARADVGALLSAADVAVSASADETFAMAVVEALVSDLPTVFCASPALDGLLGQLDRAVLVATRGDKDDDASRLAGAISRALAGLDPLRPARRGPPEVLAERFGAAAAAARVDAVYDRVHSRRG